MHNSWLPPRGSAIARINERIKTPTEAESDRRCVTTSNVPCSTTPNREHVQSNPNQHMDDFLAGAPYCLTKLRVAAIRLLAPADSGPTDCLRLHPDRVRLIPTHVTRNFLWKVYLQTEMLKSNSSRTAGCFCHLIKKASRLPKAIQFGFPRSDGGTTAPDGGTYRRTC